MSETKKMGRPIIGKPKNIRLTIRIDEDTYNKLKKYCELNNISYSEFIRQLVNK